jgi:transcriptional antiterminator NusG
MARAWYILQTYSQFENRVERNIRFLMEQGGALGEGVFDIKCPTERVVETKNGKKVEKEVKIWPGYILLEMDLPNLGWKDVVSPIKRIQGVSGFVGAVGNAKPMPISNEEVKQILMRSGDIKSDKSVLIQHNFREGLEVRITEGPFESFTGTIEEVNQVKQKLRIMVGIFGRATAVEVDFHQAEKL